MEKHSERDQIVSGGNKIVTGKETKPDSLLQKRREIYEQPYGNLGELNTCRVLLDSAGEDLLFDVVTYFLDLLDTSIAIYEKNGDYALGIFSSGWCRLLDQASRNLCATDDNAEALKSGKWHCHESCWSSAKLSMEKDQPVEIECQGGLKLFAVPIHARGEVVGSINFGCGNPPKSQGKIRRIADRYGISVNSLSEQAGSYRTQSPLAIDIARRFLVISARLIGEIVDRRLMEEDLRQSETRYGEIAAGISGIVFQLMLKKNGSVSLPFVNEAFYAISGLSAGDQGDSVSVDPSGLLDIIVPEDLDLVIKAITESAQSVKTCKTEFRIKTKSGEIKWLRAVAYPHVLSDGGILWNGVALDISEQKQAQGIGKNAGIQTELGADEASPLNGASPLIGASPSNGVSPSNGASPLSGASPSNGASCSPRPLTGGTIHDFNNILAAIMGYTELTLDGTSEENLARPYLLEMHKAIHRAKDLLSHVLTCAKGAHCATGANCDCQGEIGRDLKSVHIPGGQSKNTVQPKINRYGLLPRGEESILLVDDEEPVAYVGQQMLAYLGYKVFPRTSSLDALETFRAEPARFDLVILDQIMPNMNGTELARELIAIRPDIPIIMCTGFYEGATPKRIKDLGIRDLIMKPIDMYQIAETIRTVLVGSGVRSNHG